MKARSVLTDGVGVSGPLQSPPDWIPCSGDEHTESVAAAPGDDQKLVIVDDGNGRLDNDVRILGEREDVGAREVGEVDNAVELIVCDAKMGSGASHYRWAIGERDVLGSVKVRVTVG
jgi:hypothetical protein